MTVIYHVLSQWFIKESVVQDAKTITTRNYERIFVNSRPLKCRGCPNRMDIYTNERSSTSDIMSKYMCKRVWMIGFPVTENNNPMWYLRMGVRKFSNTKMNCVAIEVWDMNVHLYITDILNVSRYSNIQMKVCCLLDENTNWYLPTCIRE